MPDAAAADRHFVSNADGKVKAAVRFFAESPWV